MPNEMTHQLIVAQSMAATVTSSSYLSFGDATAVEVDCSATSTPVGTIKVQGTISKSNWVDLPISQLDGDVATSIAITGDVTHLLYLDNLENIVAIRVVYTATSGSGTVSAWVHQ